MAKKVALQLPLWLPVDAWNGYLLMRKQIKRPLTEYGKRLAINRLAELMAQGHNATAVLEQSIFNSWQGLFEIAGVTYGKAKQGAVNREAMVGTGPKLAGARVKPGYLEKVAQREEERLRNARNGR